MSTVDLSTMHREHLEAENEHLAWLDDIGFWRAEHRRAAALLAQIQADLLEQEAALETHAAVVRAHESNAHRHERAIADREQGRGWPDEDALTALHEELQTKHDHAREAHRRIKEHHGSVIAEITRLSERLHAAM